MEHREGESLGGGVQHPCLTTASGIRADRHKGRNSAQTGARRRGAHWPTKPRSPHSWPPIIRAGLSPLDECHPRGVCGTSMVVQPLHPPWLILTFPAEWLTQYPKSPQAWEMLISLWPPPQTSVDSTKCGSKSGERCVAPKKNWKPLLAEGEVDSREPVTSVHPRAVLFLLVGTWGAS